MKKKAGIILIALCLLGCRNENIKHIENSENVIDTELSSEIVYDNADANEVSDSENTSENTFFSDKIDDRPEIVYEDEKVISILNNRFYYSKTSANGIDYHYGLTFDKTTNEVKYLHQYIPSFQSLIQAVNAGEYSIVYGEFWRFDKEEIIEAFKKGLKEEDWNNYYSNFYIDEEYVYVIVKGTASGYSSLKLPRAYFKSVGEEMEKKDVEVKMREEKLSGWEIYTPNFYDTIKLTYNNSQEVCITFKRPYYTQGNTEQWNLFYGITIDKVNNKVKFLNDYFPSLEDLIQNVKDGNYDIIYGKLAEKPKEEVVSYIESYFDKETWEEDNNNGYYSNFYIDENAVYIIVNEVDADYSIVRIQR